MQQYLYRGPVMVFETCVERLWTATTYANSEKKARSNLAYQYKKATNRAPTAKIFLPGDLMMVVREENE